MTAPARTPRWVPPQALVDTATFYCAGCGHGTVHTILARVIDGLGLREDTILVPPVGCAVYAYRYLRVDACEAPHGRVPAVATGIKRVHPDKLVIGYQGDGDLASIGTAEIIHAANRGENITIIFINNGNYGMTGGQMAPTTLLGQRTTTSPRGRDAAREGHPLRITEMLALSDGCAFAYRGTITRAAELVRVERAIRRGLDIQRAGQGFSIIEVLSNCPTNWGVNPVDSLDYIRDNMEKAYPVGLIKGTL